MKNSSFSKCKTTLKNIPAVRILAIASFFFFSTYGNLVHAQARLSVQGILKKASGEAVDDNNYQLTFRLYTSPNPPGNALWTETQPAVEVISGIYSATLGNVTPFTNVPFNQDYYLGVTVGPANGTEMTPRVQLTSAPYALALRGQNNQFPSSGQVIADSIDVNGAVLARMGAPGLNGVNRNGYGFLGDKDSGLFSTTAGQASLYSNNVKMFTVTPDSVAMRSDLRFNNGGNINYNGLNDWRLVYEDDLGSGNNSLGWQVYDILNINEYFGWNNGNAAGNSPVSGDNTKFIGRYLNPNNNTQVLKKSYNLSGVGTYSYIKIKFKYYFIDSWNGPAFDEDNNDVGWAAIAETAGGTQFRMGWWQSQYEMIGNYVGRFGSTAFQTANKWAGDGGHTEFTRNGEMTMYKNSNSDTFWLMFGSTLNNTTSDESYGVGMIEIWVK